MDNPGIILELCDSEFWNTNLTWKTQVPRFSPCFRDTALVWLPAFFLPVVLINELIASHRARSKGTKSIPWNSFNKFRILVVFTLMMIKASETISYILMLINFYSSSGHKDSSDRTEKKIFQEGEVLVISSLIAPIIQTISHLMLLIIYTRHRRSGIHTSATTWFYLTFFVLCSSVDFFAIIASIRPAIINIVEVVVKLSHFPILLLLYILECRGDNPIIETDPSDIKPNCPEQHASFFSNITFWWFNSFLLFGYRFKLDIENLWKTSDRDKAGELVPKFREVWTQASKATKKGETYQLSNGQVRNANRIVWVLFKLLWSNLLFAASLKLFQDCLQYTTPMILKRLLAFMSSDEPAWHGSVYSLLLLLVPTIQSVVLGKYFHCMQIIGLHVRTMIIGAVYRKSLLLSGSSRLTSTSGEIVNLMAVDSHRFQDLVLYLNLIWSAPFQIVLAVYLLYRELGWSVFAGVLYMCLVLPVNAYIAKRIKLSQIKLMKTKDERVKQIGEMLSGMKVIKLYAWENSFIDNLFGFRALELRYLGRILNLDAVQTFLWQCSPFVVAIVTFAVYVNVDESNVLTAEKAFVSISLFNLLRFPLNMLPSLVTSLILTMVSGKRLNKFLNSNELVGYVTRNEELEAISIEGGTLSWSAEGGDQSGPRKPVLKDIELHVKPNSLVAIVGQVASGKTSLLSAILGELHRISGRFNICKSMNLAYVPQQAWIQNMTVRDNILFGSAYDEERYKQVLSVCCLQSDLETLPAGDQAEIGEKGINLSGGQKQRVSLARACYSNSDIFLLDDPLSALDSHVSRTVFERVLSSSTGLLRNKTRVIATNNLFILPKVDHIIVLHEGKIVESGTYKDLVKNNDGHLAEFMRQYTVMQNESVEIDQEIESPVMVTSPKPHEKSLESVPPTPNIGRLVDVEKIETGSVNYRVYLSYFKACSYFWMSAVTLSLMASSAFNVSTNLWLSIWASDAEDPEKSHDAGLRTLRLSIYAILGGLQCLAVLSGTLVLSKGAVRASRGMHNTLLERVIHSPMSFFDTTPIGRIVNRFAKDTDIVDSTIPNTIRGWLNCLLQVVSTMFIICYSFPTFLLIITPLGVVYLLIQKIFIVTTRQLKRLESNTRSPIYSHFSETLAGISCIRGYDSVDRFVNYSDSLVDRNQSCSYPNVIANRWLSVRLEFFGNLITASAALFSVYYRGTVGAGVAGLTVSYSLSITQVLSWLIRMTSDLETHIVSVERILEYQGNKQEDTWIKDQRPSPDWPTGGAIQIYDYSTRYREETDLVLKNLSLEIKPGEKIGIVGRTGSGKSSLSLTLFRILEPVTGKIVIDNLNLTDYGLHDIRSKLTIIPQDPVLFSGTLRFNLDPLKLYTDLDIWRALELAHLKPYISSLKLGLDHMVSEYGENFSVGQRQLICLARAILRKTKILVLDEATASVDVETDSIVQRTIRDVFSDCTIITIAHRLHTILDSDRILVLDFGRIKEMDTPEKLLSNPNSAFTSLARDADIDTTSIINRKRN